MSVACGALDAAAASDRNAADADFETGDGREKTGQDESHQEERAEQTPRGHEREEARERVEDEARSRRHVDAEVEDGRHEKERGEQAPSRDRRSAVTSAVPGRSSSSARKLP